VASSRLETTAESTRGFLGRDAHLEYMTDVKSGLAVLAGEIVVIALAFAVLAREQGVAAFDVLTVDAVGVAAALVVAATAIGAIRTARTTGATNALGELGVGVAVALAVALEGAPVALAVAGVLALASVALRVDGGRVQAVAAN
jgi:hypothetical protein